MKLAATCTWGTDRDGRRRDDFETSRQGRWWTRVTRYLALALRDVHWMGGLVA